MPLNASAEAKATAEQTISVLQGGHYSWQKGWLKRIPGIYARLLNYLVPYTKTVIAAMFFMVITALTSSMIAVLMGKLTDQGFYAKDVNALWWAPAALIAVALLQGGSTFGSSYLLQKVSQQVLLKIRCEMFEREIRWPAANYQKYTSGIVMSKYINEASTALGGAAQLLTTIVRDSLQLVALLGLLIWHDWKLTLVTLVVAPLIAVILRWVNKKTKKYGLQTQTALGNMMNTVLEAYQGQRIIKIYDAYEKEQTRFRGVNELLYKLSMRMQAVTAAGTPLTQFVTMAGVSIVVIVALLQAQAGHLTLGDFITFLSALLLLMNPVKKLSALNGSVARISAAAESLCSRVFARFCASRGLTLSSASIRKTHSQLALEIAKVCCSPQLPARARVKTLAPKALALATVPSVLSSSTTKISLAKLQLPKHASILCSSFLVRRTTETFSFSDDMSTPSGGS